MAEAVPNLFIAVFITLSSGLIFLSLTLAPLKVIKTQLNVVHLQDLLLVKGIFIFFEIFQLINIMLIKNNLIPFALILGNIAALYLFFEKRKKGLGLPIALKTGKYLLFYFVVQFVALLILFLIFMGAKGVRP